MDDDNNKFRGLLTAALELPPPQQAAEPEPESNVIDFAAYKKRFEE